MMIPKLFEKDFVMNAPRLWIYPVCNNNGENRCDTIEIGDIEGNKLQICVSQLWSDMPGICSYI